MQAKKPNKKATSLLNEIFNTAADGVCLIDKNFTIFAINSTLARMFSLDKEALKEIAEDKETLYDAQVVDACLNLFSEQIFSFE